MSSPAAVVVCALGLLGRSRAAAPIRFLPSPPHGVSRNAEAFIVRSPPTIYLITSAQAFRDASMDFGTGRQEGCQKVAAIIVHEEWHLTHSGSEEGAYLAEITTLEALGARSALISSVRRAMSSAVGQEKRTRALVARDYARRDD